MDFIRLAEDLFYEREMNYNDVVQELIDQGDSESLAKQHADLAWDRVQDKLNRRRAAGGSF